MPRIPVTFVIAAVVAVLAAVSGLHAAGLRAGDVWRDPQTGMAIGGYDPVAYFVSHAARQGRTGVEAVVDGVFWQFTSEANKAVFERDPGAYTPRFAGRDPHQLAQGYEALGSPHNWLVEDGALYLFVSPQSRTAWVTAPKSDRDRAESNWPIVGKATP